ncbi:Alpha/Beta hydrolase protein [Stachybotrys elegans]|uniref:Alpha/Beta hydrolase protein n=1 Tax=Stachybotrys elegans TaxID=80388 RepID=A0A8K0SL74_9HYPO|nr:Alpha/Beta hydrolase protein [Stachybotrys elegans]
MNLPDCAAELQKHGFTVLLYDPRTVGSSDGEPRNDIDPLQAVRDMSDALTHLKSLPSVLHSQAGLFGISFGGAVALSTAAVDPRVRFTIAVAPLTDLDFISTPRRWRLLQKCMKDRESQVFGNRPLIIPMVNDKGENVAGFGHDDVLGGNHLGMVVQSIVALVAEL